MMLYSRMRLRTVPKKPRQPCTYVSIGYIESTIDSEPTIRSRTLGIIFSVVFGLALTLRSNGGDLNTRLSHLPEDLDMAPEFERLNAADSVPLGSYSATEKHQLGYMKQGWNRSNLILAISVEDGFLTLPKYDAYYCSGVAIYINAGAPNILLQHPYSENRAFKLIVYPGKSGDAKAMLYKLGIKPLLGIPVVVNAQFRTQSGGWEMQAAIPWKLFNLNPNSGDQIGMAVSIVSSHDDLVQGSVNPNLSTAGVSPESDPMALNVVNLAATSKVGADVDANWHEVVDNREILLHGELSIASKALVTPSDLTLIIGDTIVPLKWEDFAVGHARVANITVPIPTTAAANGVIREILRVGSSQAPRDQWSDQIPLPVSHLQSRVTEYFATLRATDLTMSAKSHAIWDYLGQSAQDRVLQYLNRGSNLHHLIEADPNYADPVLSTIELIARDVSNPEVANNVDARVHVWQSALDKSWQAWQIVLPVNYSSNRKWPIELYFHPLYTDNETMSYLHQIAVAARGTTLPYQMDRGAPIQYEGDRIKIYLYGRGNSFEEFGDEEFNAAVSYGVEKLSGDKNRISLTGISDGASAAMIFAERYSDQIASIDLRSGGYSSETLAREEELSRPELAIVSPIYNVMEGARMLRGIVGRLSVGLDDKEFLPATKAMAPLLASFKSQIFINRIPKTGHSYTVPSLTSAFLRRPRATVDDPVEIGPCDIRHANKDGITVQSVEKFGATWNLNAYVAPGGILRIVTHNVYQFSINVPLGEAFGGASSMEIDHKVWKEFDGGSQTLVFVKRDGGWTKTSPSALRDFSRKCAASSGPMDDILRRRYLIVCGTKDKEAATAIRRRATHIVETLTGIAPGQSAGGQFEIIDDVDYIPSNSSGMSVWLLGNLDENSLYDQLNDPSVLIVSNHRMVVGGKALGGALKLASYILPKKGGGGECILIEAATEKAGYGGPILRNRVFDFAVYEIDGESQTLKVRGFFDEKWRFREDLTFMRQ